MHPIAFSDRFITADIRYCIKWLWILSLITSFYNLLRKLTKQPMHAYISSIRGDYYRIKYIILQFSMRCSFLTKNNSNNSTSFINTFALKSNAISYSDKAKIIFHLLFPFCPPWFSMKCTTTNESTNLRNGYKNKFRSSISSSVQLLMNSQNQFPKNSKFHTIIATIFQPTRISNSFSFFKRNGYRIDRSPLPNSTVSIISTNDN